MTDPRDLALRDFADNRPLAHEVLFAGPRHGNRTPPFHRELIADFHSAIPFLCWIVFRGGGKSTISEEGTTVMGGLREFKHAFLVGSSLDKACERLHAIRRIVEKNEVYAHTFGDLRGQPWSDERLEFNTGKIGRASCRERV